MALHCRRSPNQNLVLRPSLFLFISSLHCPYTAVRAQFLPWSLIKEMFYYLLRLYCSGTSFNILKLNRIVGVWWIHCDEMCHFLSKCGSIDMVILVVCMINLESFPFSLVALSFDIIYQQVLGKVDTLFAIFWSSCSTLCTITAVRSWEKRHLCFTSETE